MTPRVLRRGLFVCGVLVSSIGLIGCGTTVPLARGSGTGSKGFQEQAAAGAVAPVGGSGTVAANAAGVSPSLGVTGAGAASAVAGGSRSQAAPGSPMTGASQSGAAAASGHTNGASVPGITATTVKVGLGTANTAALQAFATATGLNASVGNADGWQTALIDWVNHSGGLAHRTLVPVYYEYQVGASNDTNNQAACAAWTQDAHVFIANALENEGSGPVSCLRSHGIISVASNYEVGSVNDFNQFAPYYYTPSSLETVSLARSYIQGLYGSGFFQAGQKIGLIYFNYPEYQVAVDRGLKPALSAYHLALSDETSITYDGNPSDLSQVTAAISGAELKFASEGIKEVLSLDSGGTIALFYMQAAQQQHQSFRYGLNSTSDGSFLEGQNGVASQLANSIIVGTKPAYDTNNLASAPPNPDRDRCFAILKAAGYIPSGAVDREAMTDICAFFFFLKVVMDRAKTLDVQGFAAAVASLGSNPGTASGSDADFFGPGRPWGAAAYAIATWSSNCACFAYRGGAHPIS
jgi:hypothetical protein